MHATREALRLFKIRPPKVLASLAPTRRFFGAIVFAGCLCATLSVVARAAAGSSESADYLVPKAPGRHALVIGNAAYPSNPLPAAVTDAANVSNVLTAAGFDVESTKDVTTQNDLVEKALKPFLNRVRKGDVVVIYYFGHGFAHNADNFLVPTLASMSVSESEIYDAFLPERAIRDLLAERLPSVAFLFLDACRIVVQFKEAGAPPPLVAQAPAAVNDQSDIVVSYAADYGDAAFAPSSDAVSYYTNALVRNLPSPGVEFSSIQRTMIYDVAKDSGNKQKAWFYSDLESLFYFVPTPEIQENERLLWQAILQDGSRDAVDTFLHQNRASVYADDARRWLVDHPAGDARLTYSQVSPLSPELKWNSNENPVELPKLNSLLGVPRTLTLDTGKRIESFASSSRNDLLAAAGTAMVTKKTGVAAASPDREDAIRLPFGQSVDVSQPASGTVLTTARIDGVERRFKLPASSIDTGSVKIGRPLAEINLVADQSLPEIVNPVVLAAQVKPIIANAKVIGWVSISAPATPDKKQARLFALQTTFIRFELTKLGIADSKISTIRNDTSHEGSVRLRFYGLTAN